MMKIPRRKFFLLAAGAAALPVVSPITKGQTYPSRPVHWIVGFPPGGPGDITARIMGQYLSERLHQPFVVENRPGAASNIATEAVVNASPDGYTLLLMTVANTVNPSLYDNLKYNSIRDIAPVAIIIGVPLVMEVNPSFPGKTVPEFLAYAKENPSKINYAHSGTGTPQHVSAGLFKFMTGINMIVVPYRGSAPALTDLLGGQVQVMFDTTPASIQHIRSGKLRPLAVTPANRVEVLPEVPTIGEFVPGYETRAWYGVGVPRNTPARIVELLNKEINAGLVDPAIKAKFFPIWAARCFPARLRILGKSSPVKQKNGGRS